MRTPRHILLVAAVSLLPLPALAQKLLIRTLVLIDGQCDFRIDNKPLKCEGHLAYQEFTNHRIEIAAFPEMIGGAAFGGGKDLQIKPESYFLTVDRMILSGGTIAPADGFCSVDMRADGQRIYNVECKALAHDGRSFQLKFIPSAKPPSIKHF